VSELRYPLVDHARSDYQTAVVQVVPVAQPLFRLKSSVGFRKPGFGQRKRAFPMREPYNTLFTAKVPLGNIVAPEIQHRFAGNPLDRADALRRDADWLLQAQNSSQALFLPMHELKVALIDKKPAADEGVQLHWLNAEELDASGERGICVFLGLADGTPRFACAVSELSPSHTLSFTDCRRAAMRLAAAEAGIIAQARAQLDWHARNQFCGNCGHPSRLARGGQLRCCDQCKGQIFPRTDPVVIMLITHAERCLLGQSAQRMPGMGIYSALAGFVDQGESIEEAVRREVFEEAGIKVGAVSYHSSQPWPFPASLMIGCHGEAITSEISIDPREMADVDWFDRDRVRSAFAGLENFKLPGDIAIAHHLIMHWLTAND